MQGEGERRIPDFLDYIFSPTSCIYTTFEDDLWVFWSKEEDKDCPDQTNKTLSSCDLTETRTIDFNFKEYLLSALRMFDSIFVYDDYLFPNFLVQFWAPKTIGGQLMLTTSHQPFGLRRIEKGLCEYRKHCINLEFNVNGDGEEFGGVIGQVFRHGKVKSHSMIESYSVKQYPQHDFALKCGVWGSCAVPVFYPSGRCCAGVLEFLYTSGYSEDTDDLPKYLLELVGIRSSLPLPSLGEIMAQLAVYFIIQDYTNYWIHRFLHCKWGYEKIHRVHHEYTAPIAFAAFHAHWAEVFILGIPVFLGPVMVPGHMITFWLWMALMQIESMETHSGYDIPWSPTKYIPFYGGADYHDYHHYVGGKSQSNFASVFTYCDYIYGTDKGYRYQKKLLQQLKDGCKINGQENEGLQINGQDINSD